MAQDTLPLSPAAAMPVRDVAGLLRRPSCRAALSLVLLFVLALMVAPRAASLESLMSMSPFIGILGVAALGQHLVIQQRGFDLSVAGAMSLAAVVVTTAMPADAELGMTLAVVALAIAGGATGGLLNGLLINLMRVPPLVTTIGLNALLTGGVYFLSNATVTPANPILADAASANLGGISVLLIGLIVMSLFASWFIARSRIGRHFIMTAVSANAAYSMGIKARCYNIATYALAGALFALAGVMIAGLSVTPSLLSGAPYMLTTVAAVIVGGSPLNGDKGDIFATFLGAVFIIFLNQLVASLGFDYAVQSLVQAGIILTGVTLPLAMNHFNLLAGKPAAKPSAATALATTPLSPATSIRAQQGPAAATDAVLHLQGIRKTFGSTIALNGVTFSARAGEVHAIIGENGAGKSTLISIAAGVLSPSAGRVVIDGREIRSRDPRDFRAAGVSVAFQHPPLPEHLNVLECLSLAADSFRSAGGAAKAQALIDRVVVSPALRVTPAQRIADLSIGQRHVVEIARALASNPKILVLDEPTEPFKTEDVAQLFALIRQLTREGVAVIYISHRLNEVEEIAERISVLRDGELIETRARRDFSRADIVNLIVGRPLGDVFPAKCASAPQAPLLDVKGLSGAGFHDISFTAAPGQIIGIAGVEGQGQRELMRALAGLVDHSGSVLLNGATLRLSERTSAWRDGVSFVSDDRHHEGLFLSLGVGDNIGIGHRGDTGQPFLIDTAAEATVIRDAISALNIKTASEQALVSSLSGGNQQKVLMAREFAARPRLILTDEPTKGVDIGAKSDIYGKLREFAQAGVTVIVSSSDGVELEGLCDKVLVMARGVIVRELTGDQVSDQEITAANLTGGELSAKREIAHRVNRLSALVNSKWLPALALLLASLAIAYFATAANGRFISSYNLTNMQVQMASLALIAFGQLYVMMLGEIDISVGPMAGLVVVMASYWIPESASGAMVTVMALAIVLIAVLVGWLQGMVVVRLGLPSIVVTLTAFFAIQGLSLLLRPAPGGLIGYRLVDTVLLSFGPLCLITVLVVAICLGFEYLLFRRPFGTALRAVGSAPQLAGKLGINKYRLIPRAFALNGLMAGIGGLVLAATIGVGTGTAGVNFTIMSITAVVLGGAVISGGYGSFIATLCGAILVQMTFSSTAFLQAGVEWEFWLVGISTLLAAGLFGYLRKPNSAH